MRWGRRNPAIAGLSLVVFLTFAWSLWSWYGFTIELKEQRDQTQAFARQMRIQRDQALDNFKRAHQAIQNSLSIRSHTPMGSSKNLLVQKQILEAGLQYYDDLLEPMRQQESLVSTEEYWLAHRERAQLVGFDGKLVHQPARPGRERLGLKVVFECRQIAPCAISTLDFLEIETSGYGLL